MRATIGVLVLVSVLVGIPQQQYAAERPLLDKPVQALLADDYRAGVIDRETYLVQSFRYAFRPEELAPRYGEARTVVPHCFTPTIREYFEAKAELSAEAVREIEGYLFFGASGLRSTYVSPDGIFEFTYETTGPDAVPADDVDPPNGIPDYVERIATYADRAWHVEIDTLGFAAPILPADGTYDISFEALSGGVLGYTTPAGSGRTAIVLHNTFTGFGMPSSNDPDGQVAGRAKSVLSHEFKHASQYTGSHWSEGSWVELDANWVMDVVFDESNIYHAWLGSPYTSQLFQPWVSLDNDGGEGNYEDFLWETFLGERFGLQIVVDFWQMRADSIAQTVKRTYQNTLNLYGADWDEAYPEYMEWCWFTGSRAEPPFGFEEAADMLRMNLRQAAVSTYPFTTSDSVDQLACHPRRFNPGTTTGYPRVIFDGSDAITNFTVSVIAEEPDGSFTIVQPTLDANNACDYRVPQLFSDLAYVGVLVTNSRRADGVQSYTLQVQDDAGGSGVIEEIASGPSRLTLEPVSPNPFAGAAAIRFSLPVPRPGSVRVYDVSGRLVRVLRDGNLAAGTQEVVWDGRDGNGRPVPAGVYWCRVDTPNESAARKVTRVR
jgi:hypothetical protein